jgi:MraZ protein
VPDLPDLDPGAPPPSSVGPVGKVQGMMFRGQFELAIDAKGRTSFPSRFRDVLTSAGDLRLILTRALFDRCLHLYPMRAWEELEAKIAEMPQFEPNVVAFRRMYLSAAVECELDKQGRILVPPSLRDHAELSKDVVWAGMGRTAELWSKERWQAAQSMSEAELQSFKTAMESLRL